MACTPEHAALQQGDTTDPKFLKPIQTLQVKNEASSIQLSFSKIHAHE